MEKRGIDVSAHQGVIDWKKVKNAGVAFAILRAGYGNDIAQKDQYFDQNYKGATAAGIPVGAYWFSYATSADDAKKEAQVCHQVLKNCKLSYPVFYDLEYDSVSYAEKKGVTITKSLATSFAMSFLKTMEGLGYYVGNYTNLDYYNRYFQEAKLKKYDLWLAHYGVAEKSVDRASIWQYSDSGMVDGITGSVDMDYCYIDYPTIIENSGKNGYEKRDDLTALKATVQERFGFSDGTMKFLDGHSNPKALYKKLATKR